MTLGSTAVTGNLLLLADEVDDVVDDADDLAEEAKDAGLAF